MITHILEILTTFSLSLIERFGYLGIAIISFLENVFTPIPSEAVIPFAGVLVSQGKMDPWLVWIASMTGGLAGTMVFYYAGYWFGLSHVYDVVAKWGKWFFIKKEDVDRSREWFERYGPWSVLVGRLIPQVRSFISIPAGVTKMPLPQFLILTTIGMGAWTAFLMWLGIYFGENYVTYLPYFKKMDVVFVGIVVILIIFFLWNRRQRSKIEQ